MTWGQGVRENLLRSRLSFGEGRRCSKLDMVMIVHLGEYTKGC